MTRSRSPLRALRAALFAAVCVVLSGTGHAAQSDHHVPVSALLLAFVLILPLAWAAGRRRRGACPLAGGLLALQAVLHAVFAAAQLHPPARTAGAHAHGAAHHVPAGPAPGLAEALLPTPGMLGAHLLAAVVCGVWLARGEAALFRLARTVFTPLRPPLTAVRLPAAPRPPLPRRRPADQPLRGAVLARAATRRGPPVLAAPRASTPPGAHV
ncbi:hypothetical protein [Streptomyces sp. CC228A]|uniref:hypothetical protein n=1 Tax=Streptomyces sp. CC228A TaxID=2898186 RepID=UPI001F3560F7|nr:hypothetical protein [Streptomyces sp. CC228A]